MTRARFTRSRAMLRGSATIAALALCIYGAVTLSRGLAVPAEALAGQDRLQRAFDDRLAQHLSGEQASIGAIQPGPVGRARLAVTRSLFRLTVPRLGISEAVLSGDATHDRLSLGPVMVKRGSKANPVTILAAHRDTHFLFIRDLREGDLVALQSESGRAVTYRIVGFQTVRWDRFHYPLDPVRPMLALATCYPFGGTEYGGPLRRVAWAEQVDHI